MASDVRSGWALVTGASTGIGFHLARELAERGYDLVVAADEDLSQAVADLEATDRQVVPVQVDLSEHAGVERLLAEIEDRDRPIEVLALNAGVGVGGAFTETSLDDDLRLIGLNVTSTVHLAKPLVRSMVERGAGRVLITASVASTMPGPYYATYAASKAFLLSFAEAIGYELDGTGVTVTALMPGPTDTEFFRRAGMEDTRVDDMDKDDPAEVARDGVTALLAGDTHVVAGSIKNRLQVVAGRLLPSGVQAALHARQTEPGTEG